MEPLDIVIIGASGGIGQTLVRALRDGNRIIGTCFKSPPAGLAEGAEYYRLDVTDRKAVFDFTGGIASNLTKPVLIYTAGISPNNPVHKMKDEEWQETLSTNLTGAFLTSRGLLPRMRKTNFGRIIFVSSVLSRLAVPGTACYSASAGALCALARVIAKENASKGIRANVLALGYFDTGMIRSVPKPYLREKVLPSIPNGSLGDPSDIAEAVRFALKTDYLNGAVIDINGGIIG